jgi:hypothetical protein
MEEALELVSRIIAVNCVHISFCPVGHRHESWVIFIFETESSELLLIPKTVWGSANNVHSLQA